MNSMQRNALRASFVLSLIGLVVSIYLTVYHYTNFTLACPNHGIINCENVLSSPYATLFGLPIAIYGIIFFLIELLFLRINKNDFLLIYNSIGIGFVFYFIYIEKVVGSICIYCTSVHIIVATLFILSIYYSVKNSKE
jgi:uncharacterized membrane protein